MITMRKAIKQLMDYPPYFSRNASRAMKVMPFAHRHFLEHLVQLYKVRTISEVNKSGVSAEFVALYIWVETEAQRRPTSLDSFHNLVSALHQAQNALAHGSKIVKAGNLQLQSVSCSGRNVIKRLANALHVGFNVRADNCLVQRLGAGHERSNLQAIETWVEKKLQDDQLPATDAVLSELIPDFEKALHIACLH